MEVESDTVTAEFAREAIPETGLAEFVGLFY